MSEKDYAINVTGIPLGKQGPAKKPHYLITLSKGKQNECFISIDRPDILNDFIQTKGVYSDLSESEILKDIGSIVENIPKENIVDMMFPSHRVLSIRSLVFNASKPSTLLK